MHSTLPSSIEGLLAERDRLEHLLHASEEWRALQQLKARSKRGEKLTSVSEGQLETLLLDTLQSNPFYKRRTAVLAEIDRLNGGGRPVTGRNSTDINASTVDDLKRIRRIDAELERRLHAMNIRGFDQIASWTSSDVQNIASTLGLGKRISVENWIEQAALLAPPKRPTATPAIVVTAVPTALMPPSPQRLSRDDAVLETNPLATAKGDTANAPAEAPASEYVLADPPRPAPARAFATVVASVKVEEPVETPAVLEQPTPSREPVVIPPQQTEPQYAETAPLQADAEDWTKQIATLEAELLDIAYGPEKDVGESSSLSQPPPPTQHVGEPHNATPMPPPLQPPPTPVVDDRFSGLIEREDYAAFRSSVEEARVEIVRSNGHGAAPPKPQVTEVQSGNAMPPAYPWPLEEPRDDSAPDRVKDRSTARFSKALTGR